MRLASVVAVSALAAAILAPASPAEAQRRAVERDRSERITIIDEQGRARTRITVRPRSYLDGGTEVFPGERKFTDYHLVPTYMNASPSAAWDPTGTHRSPLPMPYQLPGYNPYLPY
jgi:hypothetical protein